MNKVVVFPVTFSTLSSVATNISSVANMQTVIAQVFLFNKVRAIWETCLCEAGTFAYMMVAFTAEHALLFLFRADRGWGRFRCRLSTR